jgi:hypothetical protein
MNARHLVAMPWEPKPHKQIPRRLPERQLHWALSQYFTSTARHEIYPHWTIQTNQALDDYSPNDPDLPEWKIYLLTHKI